jgi:hypothetical protein
MGIIGPADDTAPGVEMTPPYQPPTVRSVGGVSCLASRTVPHSWDVRFTAELAGGRYWTYPKGGMGHTGIFHRVVPGSPASPSSYEFDLSSLFVTTPESTQPVEVPFATPVRVRCPA